MPGQQPHDLPRRSPMQRVMRQIKALRGRLWSISRYHDDVEMWKHLNPRAKEYYLENNVNWSGISEETKRHLMHSEFTNDRVLKNDEGRHYAPDEHADIVSKYAPRSYDSAESASRAKYQPKDNGKDLER
jgi:hypothetical protein